MARPIVLDASVFIARILPDEPKFQEQASRVFMQMHSGKLRAHVPPHFRIEAANALLTSLARKRITREDHEELLSILDNFPVTIDEATPLRPVTEHAIRHRLTMYDAAYLELALRCEAVYLFTFDKALAKAAKSEDFAVHL